MSSPEKAGAAGPSARRSPLDNRRPTHAVADRVAVVGVWPTRVEDHFVDRLLELGCESESAVALWEMDPRESQVELGAEELCGRRRLRRMLGQQPIDEIDDAPLVGANGGLENSAHRQQNPLRGPDETPA